MKYSIAETRQGKRTTFDLCWWLETEGGGRWVLQGAAPTFYCKQEAEDWFREALKPESKVEVIYHEFIP